MDGRDDMWDRWDEVDRVFEAALEHAPERRRAYVEDVCGPDHALRDAVLKLLESSDRAEGFLRPPADLLRAAFDRPKEPSGAALGSGEIVGRFRVIRELGRGGMATVYEAERVESGFEQRVALKVLQATHQAEEVVRRFVAERRILSGLVHPNIARLLDGGTTADGRPYIVMEKVEGEPITTWADARQLTVRERLDLFAQVAAAVGYAHAHLVVHRDLKPANVMVDSEGRVKLLDFGIAKLVESQDGEDATTGPATRWMTPQYASPEQILGLPVTTAADVHGLGVVLYELLTGHRPFGGDVLTGFELQRAICEEAPERPSAIITRTVRRESDTKPDITPDVVARDRGSELPLLRRLLMDDLDAVVLKALRKEPESRYGTVQAFLDDIERYRSGFPVMARSGAWTYRARKFVRRNWLGVSAAAALVAILAGASVLLSIQQHATAVQRDRAEREATNAGLVIDFLADVFRGRDPTQAPSDTITARELLVWGLERVDSEFADRPEVQAELLTVMGGAHYNLGMLDESVAVFERALALDRQLYGDTSAEVANALSDLAATHTRNRDFALAEPLLREMVSIDSALTGPESSETANALGDLAMNERDLGRLDEAERLLRRTIDIHRRQPADSADLVADMLRLAYVMRAQDRLDDARGIYEEAIPRYRAIHGPRDPDLATYLNNLAYLYRVQENYAAAEPLYREAVAIVTDIYGRGHPAALQYAANLAGVLQPQGKTEDLLALLHESLDAARAQWPDGHWRVGSAYEAYGKALLQSGRAREAAEPLDSAVSVFAATLGPAHEWTEFAMVTRAVGQIFDGRERQGRSLIDRFYAGLKARVDSNDGIVFPGTINEIQSLLHVLDNTGLDDYAAEFRSLLGEEADS